MCISVALCEWNFSKLKLVKNRLQMSDVRLLGLAVHLLERELAQKLEFHDVIKELATHKARKFYMI